MHGITAGNMILIRIIAGVVLQKNYGLPCQHYLVKIGFHIKLSDILSHCHLDYDIDMALYNLVFLNLFEL